MKQIITFLLVCLFLASCSTSNQVVSNKLFKKRKYQKGWYVNTPKNYKVTVSKKKIESKHQEENNQSKSSFVVENSQKKTLIEKVTVEDIPVLKQEHFTYLDKVEKNITDAKSGFHSKKIKLKSQFNKQISIVKKEKSPPINRGNKTSRVLLVLLALGILFYTQIAPLAILIALGKVESLRVNLIIFLVGIMVLAIALFTMVLLGVLFTPAVMAMIFIGLAFIVAADIHAIYVIYRGY